MKKEFLKKLALITIRSVTNSCAKIYPKISSKIAYTFFSTPFDGKLNARKMPSFLEKAQLKWGYCENEKFPIYIWSGSQFKILLIHGWESNAARWEQTFAALENLGATFIAIDGPSHGLASGKEFSVPLYAKFIDVAINEFQPQLIIGHSIGGSASLFHQAIYKAPSVKNLIILGAPADLKVLLINYKKIMGFNDLVIFLLEQYLEKKYQLKVTDFDGERLGMKLDITGLIIHDEEDDVVSINEAEKIKKGWQKAQFLKTKGLGHSMHDDSLYQKIAQFIRQETTA